MRYEVYIDSLFALQFIFNLYLLIIVNHMLYHAANLKRLVAGAFLGAICYVVPLLLPLRLYWSILVGSALALLGMSLYVFHCLSREQMWKVLEKMFLVSLLLGGFLKLMFRMVPLNRHVFCGLPGVMLLGGLATGFVYRMWKGGSETEVICSVQLKQGKRCMMVKGILDTGNSLVEPISQSPVAVLGKEALEMLFTKEQREFFRVIPYRSVGKQHGFLKGYLLDEMMIEIRGGKKVCKQVYIAACEEFDAKKCEYQLIMNPQILENKE